MLARYASIRHRVSPRRLPQCYTLEPQRRHLIQELSNGFADLSLALPIPPSFPPYSVTIILVTALTRLAFLPTRFLSRWMIRRDLALVPELRSFRPTAVAKAMQFYKGRYHSGKDSSKTLVAKKANELILKERSSLRIRRFIFPRSTILSSALVRLVVFAVSTAVYHHAARDPTTLDFEAFLTLTSLSRPDSTMTLPIILGLITLADVESGGWRPKIPENAENNSVKNKTSPPADKANETTLRPLLDLLKPFLRLFSVFRIGLAAMSPGSVVVYWVTSAAFNLVETWSFNWLDHYRRLKLLEQKKSLHSSPAIVTSKKGVKSRTKQT